MKVEIVESKLFYIVSINCANLVKDKSIDVVVYIDVLWHDSSVLWWQ